LNVFSLNDEKTGGRRIRRRRRNAKKGEGPRSRAPNNDAPGCVEESMSSIPTTTAAPSTSGELSISENSSTLPSLDHGIRIDIDGFSLSPSGMPSRSSDSPSKIRSDLPSSFPSIKPMTEKSNSPLTSPSDWLSLSPSVDPLSSLPRKGPSRSMQPSIEPSMKPSIANSNSNEYLAFKPSLDLSTPPSFQPSENPSFRRSTSPSTNTLISIKPSQCVTASGRKCDG